MLMKKRSLLLAILASSCFAQIASAQEMFDDRWYATGTLGYLWTDSGRGTDDDLLLGGGVGKRITPNLALDLSASRAEVGINYDGKQGDQSWYLWDVTASARYYFTSEGRTWNPYLVAGLGGYRHHEQRNSGQNIPGVGPGYGGERIGWNLGGIAGAGIESDRRKRIDYRVEAGTRWDDDGNADYWPRVTSSDAESSDSFWDFYLSASLLVKVGDLPVPVVAAPIDCSALDGDNDGVNDCIDKCPDSQPGQTIGADGCPVKLVIDLKGVNFDFDKATLRDDSVVILDEAVAVLNKYPQLRVAVDGHTDLCGAADYNQQLSEKRAGTVFQYLVDKGIATDRLVGPTGYGESNPLVATGDKFPECKNETNRRTELNVQN